MPTKKGKKLTEEETREKRHQAGLKGAETKRRNKAEELRKQNAAKNKRKDEPKQNWFSQNLVSLILLLLLVLVVLAWAIQTVKTSAPAPAASQTPIVWTATPIVVPPTATQGATIASGSWPTNLFQSPVTKTAVFNVDSSWIIAEPGVINDATTAWTVGQTKTTYYQNVPEGAFAYFSLGEGIITIDGVNLNLKGEKGLNYLVVIRGRIDDNIVDSDLNMTAEVNNFVLGHAIWSYMPKGAYVSKNWFTQQMVASTTEGFTNCGAEGCSRLKIVLFDVDSHYYQIYEIHAGDLSTWTLIEAGTK